MCVCVCVCMKEMVWGEFPLSQNPPKMKKSNRNR